ncbi:MAG: hypothetical protein LUG99_05385 [Lachnospiraceae bacterium]|nr:hypothetical protein [Lachnospiraceae bacterium]
MAEIMFAIRTDEEGHLTFLGHKKDPDRMNWVDGNRKWGTIQCPSNVSADCTRQIKQNGMLEEVYLFRNTSAFPIFLKKTDLGIYTTFNDDYECSEICMKQRCHTHIFCGGEGSYVMALRMGGQGPHLGLRMTCGGLSGYSVERQSKASEKWKVVSNDRGDFIMHPYIPLLAPGETVTIGWELFWFDKPEDFEFKLAEGRYTPVILAQQCTYFTGEKISFDVLCGERVSESLIHIFCDQEEKKFSIRNEDEFLRLHCTFEASGTGEHEIEVIIKDKKTKALFYVSPDLRKLVRKRCEFIAARQQYHGKAKSLNGAYLIYDNEENRLYYNHSWHDHNAGRERLGMGALIALWLQKEEDKFLQDSLMQYKEYVYRELYDQKSGTVFNDIGRSQEIHRLYNFPWMAIFQLELYNLTKEKNYLNDSFQTMRRYYLNGGVEFYAIGIPAEDLFCTLKKAGMEKEAEEFRKWFLCQADYIFKNSIAYPPSEVNYEQSIVAPAVSILLQGFSLSGEERYLKEAEKQLSVLRLFHGRQPNYLQFENAIRHWDGYWFGKHQLLGDTYPHYWSALSGVAFLQYADITADSKYLELARASFRGCLSLFSEYGEASCAMIFPEMVNGEKAHCHDPWANDQDWALYFVLKSEKLNLWRKDYE